MREILSNSLNNSAKSIPLVLPLKKAEVCFWQFRNIVKTWQEVRNELVDGVKQKVITHVEERIFNYATPIVSFLRLGDNLKMSKSLFINKTLFDKNFQVFQDLRSTAAQTPLSHVGMVDAAWVAP